MDAVIVELDEDIELNVEQERIYVQVKTRVKPIIPSDYSSYHIAPPLIYPTNG